MIALPEVALAEASRQIGFIAGRLGTEIDQDGLLVKESARKLYSEVRLGLFDIVCSDWEFIPPKDELPDKK
jgi:hypothetical protein